MTDLISDLAQQLNSTIYQETTRRLLDIDLTEIPFSQWGPLYDKLLAEVTSQYLAQIETDIQTALKNLKNSRVNLEG